MSDTIARCQNHLRQGQHKDIHETRIESHHLYVLFSHMKTTSPSSRSIQTLTQASWKGSKPFMEGQSAIQLQAIWSLWSLNLFLVVATGQDGEWGEGISWP